MAKEYKEFFVYLFTCMVLGIIISLCFCAYFGINTCYASEITRVEVHKSAGMMYLYNEHNEVEYRYIVRTGLNGGAKHCDGDKKTPEGTYKVIDKWDSKYVKFLAIDYPNKKDIERAKELGCNPGDSIGIHYYNKEYTNDPSTLEGSLGCITVWSKTEMMEISEMVKVGTEVIIKK